MCQYVLYKVKCSIKQNLIIIVNSQCFETFILIFLEFILARPRGKLELFADSFVNWQQNLITYELSVFWNFYTHIFRIYFGKTKRKTWTFRWQFRQLTTDFLKAVLMLLIHFWSGKLDHQMWCVPWHQKKKRWIKESIWLRSCNSTMNRDGGTYLLSHPLTDWKTPRLEGKWRLSPGNRSTSGDHASFPLQSISEEIMCRESVIIRTRAYCHKTLCNCIVEHRWTRFYRPTDDDPK